MIVIRRLEDIREAKGLDEHIRKWLEGLFRRIAAAYADGGAWEDVSLERVGPIAFLEGPDDCQSLRAVGLNGAYRATCPELVEEYPLEGAGGERPWMYVSTVVRNNSVAVTLCSIAGGLDATTEEFLRGNVC